MNSNKNLSIQLKLDKAKTLYSEVKVLMEHKLYSTAINRLYYACFHATRALLLVKDLTPKTHSGIIAMLHKYFVLEGLFDMEKAAFISRLMQERSEDDYSDFITYEKEAVEKFINPAWEYIVYTEQLVKQMTNEYQ